jgi:hypothetical protein
MRERRLAVLVLQKHIDLAHLQQQLRHGLMPTLSGPRERRSAVGILQIDLNLAVSSSSFTTASALFLLLVACDSGVRPLVSFELTSTWPVSSSNFNTTSFYSPKTAFYIQRYMRTAFGRWYPSDRGQPRPSREAALQRPRTHP